ncbi:MAG: hypothetical protein FD168_537 [Desulfobulbaceae bacterium]|nr:MAG: hypothetical protein FD168_537 [Desulfobulbaceae bacterium]
MKIDALPKHTTQIFYDIENSCIGLYDRFQDYIFPDRDRYYTEQGLVQQWVYHLGLDSDFASSKDIFNIWVQEIVDGKYYGHLFLADCQNLIGFIQNRILATRTQYENFYKHLDEVGTSMFCNDGVYWTTGENSIEVFSSLHDLFITMYASLDLITKLAFQFENMPNDYSKYQKMKSKSILFGNRINIEAINKDQTIFEENPSIKTIENLRHELIHNGTWESVPKVHYRIENREITERYIYMPDLTIAGTIEVHVNRKRFFSKENKINETLPDICIEFWQRVCVTLEKIRLTNYQQ